MKALVLVTFVVTVLAAITRSGKLWLLAIGLWTLLWAVTPD